jgi:membrane protein
MRLSAAIAYYSAFSLAPLLVIAISVAAMVFGHDAVSGHLHKELTAYVGPQAADAVESMIRNATKRGVGLLGATVGLATVLASRTRWTRFGR